MYRDIQYMHMCAGIMYRDTHYAGVMYRDIQYAGVMYRQTYM